MLCYTLSQSIKQGVFDVIPRGSLDGLTSEDLRLLLNGMGEINTQSLISYTSFNDETGDSKCLYLYVYGCMGVYDERERDDKSCIDKKSCMIV